MARSLALLSRPALSRPAVPPRLGQHPWDWFHVNTVQLDTDGNLLIDARDTWATYKVSLRTGKIIWRLGG